MNTPGPGGLNTPPPIRYAHGPNGSVAYTVIGEGPVDLVLASGPASHIELLWEEPGAARALTRMASFSRLVVFDRCGTGLSDPGSGSPTFEQQVDDLFAVMDAVGLERTALFGATDIGLCSMVAATHPDRVTALALWAAGVRASEALTPELVEQLLDVAEQHWGEGTLVNLFAPSRAEDPAFCRWWAKYERHATTPQMARKLLTMLSASDVSALLPNIRCPTLVLHRVDDALIPIASGRAAAALIPNARLVELSGTDNYGFSQDVDAWIDPVEEFLTGARTRQSADRMLLTVLFTDIVDSTQHASASGDRKWRALLEMHDAIVRDELARWRGRELKRTGDGFLATFDGPARAVQCAQEIVESLTNVGLQVRAGVHTGECELLDRDIGGIAVHIGARICELAQGGEVLVSSTVKDLVVGSELQFSDRGVHRLRGIPDEWRLFANN